MSFLQRSRGASRPPCFKPNHLAVAAGLLWAASCLSACSALVDPDRHLLGGSASPVTDGGVGPTDGGGRDGGAPRPDGAAVDGGAVDGGGGGACSGPPRCVDGTLTFCQGGIRHTERCPLGCSGAGDSCGEPRPSNIDPSFWDPAAPDVDLDTNGDVHFDTTACAATSAPSMIVAQADGPTLCVIQSRTFRVRPQTRLVVIGERPLVIAASGNVDVEGVIDVSARGLESGPGGYRGGVTGDSPAAEVGDGEGPGGGGLGEHDDPWSDGGGGGGGLCGAGGRGGRGGAAAGGTSGGAVAPSWDLTPLAGGSGGGRGRGIVRGPRVSDTNAGFGGAGGGALQISTPLELRLRGAIVAGGGGGLAGSRLLSDNWGSGGGGGSGGSILLEATDVIFDDGSRIDVAGGGGGGGAGNTTAQDGEDGRDADPVARGGAGGSVYGAGGGDSAGGASVGGEDGGDNTGTGNNAGGGGGGAGCIMVRVARPASVDNAAANPSVAPAFRVLRLRSR